MARARNIKPSFFTNDDLAEIPAIGRLLFIGLWTLSDREGRLEDRPKRIKAQLFAYDEVDCDAMLGELERAGFIRRYVAQGVRCIHIVNFLKHQMPHHKEAASELPPPDGMPAITRHTYDVSPAKRDEIFDRDGRKCLKCGTEESLSLDHIVPLSAGGTNDDDNLQTLCKRCNSAKGDTTKDHRQVNVGSTSSQRRVNRSAPCPSDSLLLIPDSSNPPLTPPPDGDGGEKPKRERKPRVSLKTFIAKCVEAGEKPISEYRPLQEYVQATGLPMEFVQLCWQVFKAEFLPPGAKAARLQADWRRHFLTFVEKGYYRLWFAKADGSFELTTAGLQARSFHGHREAA